MKMPPPIPHATRLAALLAASLPLLAASAPAQTKPAPAPASATAPAGMEAVVLSPFEVVAEGNDG